MTRTLPFKLLLALLLAPLAVQAQVKSAVKEVPNTFGRPNWPRTFGGQPDFEFTRAEVVEDRAKQKDKPYHAPTLADLLEDVPLDPLKLGPQTSSTISISGTSDVVTIPTADTNAVIKLPELNLPDGLDLGEFRAGLKQRLAEYVRNWQPNLQAYDISYLLRGLQLGGVMTSPERRAIINGTTYKVGDQLKATVVIAPSDVELMSAMEEQMPAEGSITPEQAALYQEAYEQEVAALAADKQKNPQAYQRTFTLPISVRAIQSRKVTLEFNGVTYDLAVSFAM